MTTATDRSAALSALPPAGFGPRATEAQSEAIARIKEDWDLLSRDLQKALLADLLRSL